MITYLAIFLLGVFILYKLSSAFSNALIGVFSSNEEFLPDQRQDIQELFFRTVFILLGYIARRDGAINAKEVKRTETYMEKMELDSTHKREAIRLFKLGADPRFEVSKTINQFQWLAQKSPTLVQILLVYLINLARVDGLLVTREVEAVEKIAMGLGYTNLTFKHLLKMVSAQNKFDDLIKPTNKQGTKPKSETASSSNASAIDTEKSCEEQTRDFNHRSDQLSAAYSVFNLSPSASDAEIKKSYRSLVSQYHPDKLISLGLPHYMIQSATECFKKIQAAYDYIKAARA